MQSARPPWQERALGRCCPGVRVETGKGYEQGQDFTEKKSLSAGLKDPPSSSTKQRRRCDDWLYKPRGPFTSSISRGQVGRRFTEGDEVHHKQKLRKMPLNPSDKAASQTRTCDLLSLSRSLGALVWRSGGSHPRPAHHLRTAPQPLRATSTPSGSLSVSEG